MDSSISDAAEVVLSTTLSTYISNLHIVFFQQFERQVIHRPLLDALVSLFDIESAEIKLLHVVETLWLPMDQEAGPGEAKDPETAQADQVALELRQEAEQLLNEARARILPHHPGIASSIREGLPATEIPTE